MIGTDETSTLTRPARLAEVPLYDVADALDAYAGRLALGVDTAGTPLPAAARADLAVHGLAAAGSLIERVGEHAHALVAAALAAGVEPGEVSAALGAPVSEVSGAVSARVSGQVSALVETGAAAAETSAGPAVETGNPPAGDLPAGRHRP